MKEVIGFIVGMITAILLFSVLPSVLLLFEYNAAIAVAYFFASLSLLSIGWQLSSMGDKLKFTADSLRMVESRLFAIESHLSDVSASTGNIERDLSKLVVSQLPSYPPEYD